MFFRFVMCVGPVERGGSASCSPSGMVGERRRPAVGLAGLLGETLRRVLRCGLRSGRGGVLGKDTLSTLFLFFS